MFHLIKSIFCIYIFCISLVPAYKNCVTNYKVEKQEFDDQSSPPAILTQTLKVSRGNESIIEVWLKQRSIDFNLTLFANPFVVEKSRCDLLRIEDENLRQFFKTCKIFKNNEDSKSVRFGKIFTGCYYFMMTSKEGKSWRLKPVFYKTNYTYFDTKLEVSTKIKVKPAHIDTTIELITELKVPLDCLKVRAELFELKKGISDPIDDIKSGRIQISQECLIAKDVWKRRVYCAISSLTTNLTLNVLTDIGDYGWTAEIVWTKLQAGGGQYYLHFMPDLTLCRKKYRRGNMDTWRPPVKDIWISHGLEVSNNAPANQILESKHALPWVLIVTFPTVLITLLMLGYGMLKFRQLMMQKTCRENEFFEKPKSSITKYNETESNKILLMYVKGSFLFMRMMSSLRFRLEKYCQCCIKDVYATNEWPDIAALGATEWVEQQLKSGSKVIWVDTPQFRSLFNDKEKVHTWDDFRDEAALHAVDVARIFFQNAKTQYRCHFVVRMKGFEVDDRQEDPLQMFTPYTRYYIPDHLSLLCEHLKSFTTRFEDKENGE